MSLSSSDSGDALGGGGVGGEEEVGGWRKVERKEWVKGMWRRREVRGFRVGGQTASAV